MAARVVQAHEIPKALVEMLSVAAAVLFHGSSGPSSVEYGLCVAVDSNSRPWDNFLLMKKAVVIVFVVIFAAGMFHYFYSEEHCPVSFPSAGGGFDHVHHHHRNAPTCFCSLSALLGPESDDWVGATDFRIMLTAAGENRLRASLGADIAHPPKYFLL